MCAGARCTTQGGEKGEEGNARARELGPKQHGQQATASKNERDPPKVGAIKISKTYAGPFRVEDKRQHRDSFGQCRYERRRSTSTKKKREPLPVNLFFFVVSCKQLQSSSSTLTQVRSSIFVVKNNSVKFIFRKKDNSIKMLKFVAVFALVASAAFAAPASSSQDSPKPRSLLEDAFSVYTSCQGESDISVCLKLKALRFVDRAARSADISILDGVKIVQTEEAKSR